MATVTSVFQGITTPISQLYDEIHTRGWQVTKVNVQDGRFVATAKNPQGETVEKVGRDQNTALAALLMYIMRREYIRQGAWTNHWADKLEPIAQDYAKAPHFDPQAAAAWKELADDCVARAAVLSHQLQIEVTHDPEPYSSPQELWEDVQKNRHLSVSDAATEHPVWTRDQVIAFRICHDVLGHAAAGGDFGWTGENLATAAHMPYLTPNAQHALFAETVGQAAYNNYYRGRGPQKITLLKDHLSPLQDEHNPPGHGGEHPSMTLSPGTLPTRSSGIEALYHVAPVEAHDEIMTHGLQGAGRASPWGGVSGGNYLYGDLEDAYDYRDRFAHGRYAVYQVNPTGLELENDPEGEDGTERYIVRHAIPPENLSVVYHPNDDPGLPKLGGAIRDPNYGYETNIVPPAANAVTLYDDPLEHMKVKDQAHALDTGWANWKKADGEPDLQRMKIAVTNAFRAALLSPLKTLQWNATQYQDLSHIPHDTGDPKVYWDALESARINHNKSQGFPDPEIRHKSHYPALLDFYRYYARHNPHLNPSEVRAAADREVQIMQAEIEEAVLAKSKDTDMDIIEPKVYKELAKRLKIIVKDDKPLHQASAVENPYNPDRKAYGGFIGRHLIAIAQVAKYADILTEAALEDVKRHDGTGHTFRATTLRLGIPYVGPKVVSFAWLLLQPLTSQLATVDSHMAEALGYKYKDVANNRDYFRLERELMAGRDAAGYGHMPLGQFQWGLWDYKRTGPGSHQDHTPLKPYEPTPHHQVLWATPEVPNPNQHKPEWIAPEWWSNTQPYRDAEREAWSHDVAVKYPKGQVPWKDEPVFVPHTAMAADPSFIQQWIEKHGPYLYHKAQSPAMAKQISEQGLIPWDDPRGFGSHYNKGYEEESPISPRPGHVYLRRPRGNQATYPHWVRVDMRQLDPALMNPDEDVLHMTYNERGYEKAGLPWVEDREKRLPSKGETRGQWAERMDFGSNPQTTEYSLTRGYGPLAYRGIIPPEALDVPGQGITKFAADDGTDDEVHLALEVPEWVRKKIAEFVGTLNISPQELLDPNEYHITVAYAPHGVRDLEVHTVKNSFNLTGLRFESKALKKLGDAGALVVEFHNEDFDTYASAINDWLEDEGIEVSRYDDGYTPHITVAYIDGPAPSVEVLPLAFRAGGLSFSTPRAADKIPSLWAKHLAHRLAAQHYECTNCHYDYGPEPPNTNLVKHCPGCGLATMYEKYHPSKGYEKVPRYRVRHNPSQMTIQQEMPTEVKYMPKDERSDFDSSYTDRLTLAYDSQNNTLYVGPTGTWHQHAGKYFGINVVEGEYGNALTDNDPNFYVGAVFLPNLPYSESQDSETHELMKTPGANVKWYHRTPPNAEQIEKAMGLVVQQIEEDEDFDWEDDDDNEMGADPSKPKIMSELPIGTTWSHAGALWKVTENDQNFTQMIVVDAQGNKVSGPYHYPPSLAVPDDIKLEPNVGEQPKPKTMGEAPVGSLWQDGEDGPVYKIADEELGTTYTELYIDSYGHKQPPGGKVPNNSNSVFPTSWVPYKETTEEDEWGQFPEGTQVYYIYKPGVWTVVDVTEDAQNREWQIKNNVSGEHLWVSGMDLHKAQSNHPEFDGMKDEPDQWPEPKETELDPAVLAEDGYDFQQGPVKFHHGDKAYLSVDGKPVPVTVYSERMDGRYIVHDIHNEEYEVLEDALTSADNKPQPPQSESPFKVGDYVYLSEEWQEQQNPDIHDFDTTPYKVLGIQDDGNLVTKDPFDGSLVEAPPHAFDQAHNEPELLSAQEAHGDPMDPSDNVHAVFAHGTDGKNFRISPWTSWDDAQEQWSEHQHKLHVPFDWPTGGSTVRDKKETDPDWSHNVAHYGVRSGGDPAYRNLPRGDINHPPQPFKVGQKVMVGGSLGTITGMGDGPGYWKIQFTDGSTAQYYQTGITQYYQTNPGQPGTFSRVLRRMGLRGPMAYHERPEIAQEAVSAPLMGIPVEYRQRLGYSKALEEHDAKVKAALSRREA